MQIEWLILADAAQIADGKLYLLGGGWDRIWVNAGFPSVHSVALAISFRVPWNETNQLHQVEVEITDQDHAGTLVKIEGSVEVGRPAGLEPGGEQRSQFVANFPLRFEWPGTYAVNARVKDGVSARTTFTVVPGPLLAMKMASGGA